MCYTKTVQSQQDAAPEELAPIDYIAVEFPDGTVAGDGFQRLLDLVDQGSIRVLDVEFVATSTDGSTARIAAADVQVADGVDLTPFVGASSGILDAADLAELAASTTAGAVTAVVIYENLWIFSVVDAWRRHGARLISDGGVSPEDLIAALDATETN